MKRLLVVLMMSAPALGQVITDSPRGVVVAHEGRVRLEGGWNVEGVREATEIVASNDRVVVLDALHDRAVIIELANGRAARITTGATPIGAAFIGRDLYILSRDSRELRRAGGPAIRVEADPAFLAVANQRLYVYSRTAGVIEEIHDDRITRRVRIAPFASDFEVDGRSAYLAYPRESRIRTIDLEAMRAGEAIDVGAVPVDIALTGGGTAITARILAVADPSAKRIWLTEGRQSTGKAIARGFVRGLLGLGLYGNRSSQFPTGVDRVIARGARWIAYDSSSGTLYRVTRQHTSIIAKGVAPKAFTLTADGVAFWHEGLVRTVRTSGTSVAQTRRK